ncbi:MAG: hypothetical protein K940chlam3_00197 [Chlamydiae bacterium]|nr:hypothetical protein [Chlamydiota bacterium]
MNTSPNEDLKKAVDIIMEERGPLEPSKLIPMEVLELQARSEIREMLRFNEEAQNIKNALHVLAVVGPQIHGQQYMEKMFEELHGVGERMEEFADRIANEPNKIIDIIGISYESLESILIIAKDQYENNQMKSAEHLYFLLTTFCPFNADFWFCLGSARQNQEKYIEATQNYIKAAEVDTKDPLPYLYAAECCLNEGDLKSAEMWQDAGLNRLHEIEDNEEVGKLFSDFNDVMKATA